MRRDLCRDFGGERARQSLAAPLVGRRTIDRLSAERACRGKAGREGAGDDLGDHAHHRIVAFPVREQPPRRRRVRGSRGCEQHGRGGDRPDCSCSVHRASLSSRRWPIRQTDARRSRGPGGPRLPSHCASMGASACTTPTRSWRRSSRKGLERGKMRPFGIVSSEQDRRGTLIGRPAP